ncbi:MAG: head GIN domain-containing protein [Pseudomonadota bacterium]
MIRFILKTLIVISAWLPPAALSEPFDVAPFSTIRAVDGVDVVVRQGGEQSVVLAQGNAPSDAKVTVSNGVLTLGRARNGGISTRLGHQASLRFDVMAPSLEGLDSRAGADVTIIGVDATSLTLEARSGADIKVSGTCDTLIVTATAGGDIDAQDLSCREVTARSSGGGEVSLVATSSVDAVASSGSDIVVYGDPATRKTRDRTGGRVVIRD